MGTRVKIVDTGETLTLELLDGNGIDWSADFIAGRIPRSLRDGLYQTNKETYCWWRNVLAEREGFEKRYRALCQKHGWEKVIDALGDSMECDVEDQATCGNAALDKAFGADE